MSPPARRTAHAMATARYVGCHQPAPPPRVATRMSALSSRAGQQCLTRAHTVLAHREQNGTCVCQPSWRGDDCSIPTCPNECSGSGHCIDMKCLCQAGWSGDDCSQRACPAGCSGHGMCGALPDSCSPSCTLAHAASGPRHLLDLDRDGDSDTHRAARYSECIVLLRGRLHWAGLRRSHLPERVFWPRTVP